MKKILFFLIVVLFPFIIFSQVSEVVFLNNTEAKQTFYSNDNSVEGKESEEAEIDIDFNATHYSNFFYEAIRNPGKFILAEKENHFVKMLDLKTAIILEREIGIVFENNEIKQVIREDRIEKENLLVIFLIISCFILIVSFVLLFFKASKISAICLAFSALIYVLGFQLYEGFYAINFSSLIGSFFIISLVILAILSSRFTRLDDSKFKLKYGLLTFLFCLLSFSISLFIF
ncbi:hypothetical protein EOL94_03365 [bacterium]|nr:hypothetical protein [bacterium]